MNDNQTKVVSELPAYKTRHKCNKPSFPPCLTLLFHNLRGRPFLPLPKWQYVKIHFDHLVSSICSNCFCSCHCLPKFFVVLAITESLYYFWGSPSPQVQGFVLPSPPLLTCNLQFGTRALFLPITWLILFITILLLLFFEHVLPRIPKFSILHT